MGQKWQNNKSRKVKISSHRIEEQIIFDLVERMRNNKAMVQHAPKSKGREANDGGVNGRKSFRRDGGGTVMGHRRTVRSRPWSDGVMVRRFLSLRVGSDPVIKSLFFFPPFLWIIKVKKKNSFSKHQWKAASVVLKKNEKLLMDSVHRGKKCAG